MIQRGLYRVRQVWWNLTARPLSENELTSLATTLNEGEMALFLQQSVGGQRHGLRVMRYLKESGCDQQDLLTAALLHDIGKELVHISWLDRSIVVLGQRFFPKWSSNLSNREPVGWHRAFVVKARHADWGAEAAQAIGSSTTAVQLIRYHQDPTNVVVVDEATASLLTLLQMADNQN